jgi:hypothetical protein
MYIHYIFIVLICFEWLLYKMILLVHNLYQIEINMLFKIHWYIQWHTTWSDHAVGGGYLQCIYSKTDGYNYVTLYNNDTNTDETSTFLFSCFVSNPYTVIFNILHIIKIKKTYIVKNDEQ